LIETRYFTELATGQVPRYDRDFLVSVDIQIKAGGSRPTGSTRSTAQVWVLLGAGMWGPGMPTWAAVRLM